MKRLYSTLAFKQISNVKIFKGFLTQTLSEMLITCRPACYVAVKDLPEVVCVFV